MGYLRPIHQFSPFPRRLFQPTVWFIHGAKGLTAAKDPLAAFQPRHGLLILCRPNGLKGLLGNHLHRQSPGCGKLYIILMENTGDERDPLPLQPAICPNPLPIASNDKALTAP